MRRVVVTGLEAISPLGVGARHSWKRLIAADSGISSVAELDPKPRWKGLSSTVSGIVPSGGSPEERWRWRPSDWLDASDQKRMPKFAQYAVAASEMALEDAQWKPTGDRDLEMTGVCLGSGIGNLDETYSTVVNYEKDVSSSFARPVPYRTVERAMKAKDLPRRVERRSRPGFPCTS